MPGSGLGYLLSALTGGVSGYVNQKNKQDQLELQKRKAEQEVLANKANMYAKGLAADPSGNIVPAEGYAGQGENYFDATGRRSFETKAGKEIPVEGALPSQLASLFPQGSKIREGDKSDYLKEFIKNSAAASSIPQEAIDQYALQAGVSPETASSLIKSSAGRTVGGSLISGIQKSEQKKVQEKRDEKQAAQFREAENRRQKAYELDRQRFEVDLKKLPQEVATKVTANNQFTDALMKVRNMVASGRLQPGTKLAAASTAMSMAGPFSGKVAEISGLSPDEQEALRLWNAGVIDKVVSNAASTFSDRFISTQKGALPNLSADPKTFLKQIDSLIDVENKFKKSLVESSVAAKSGKLADLVGASPQDLSSQRLNIPKQAVEEINKYPVPKGQKSIKATLTPAEQKELADLEKRFGKK